jgi:hypothetical protein
MSFSRKYMKELSLKYLVSPQLPSVFLTSLYLILKNKLYDKKRHITNIFHILIMIGFKRIQERKILKNESKIIIMISGHEVISRHTSVLK